MVVADRIERLPEPDEVDRDELRPLVDQLVEAVLAVRPGLAPVDRARLVVDDLPVERDVLAVRLHGQLLEVRGEALQVLAVRHDTRGLRPEEIAVPDGEKPHERREVPLERRRPEVLVHRVEACEQLAKALGPHREHRREPDRRVHRVAPADPVPEAEHVLGVDPERRHLVRVRRYRHEVLRDRGLVTQRGQGPLARGVRVRHRLERRERLRRDDEERLVGREVLRRLGEIGRVDIRHEAEREVAPRVVTQGLVRHHGPEVRAADPDVDDVSDRLPRVPSPFARTDALGERRHAVEDLVHVGDDVDAVDDERRPFGMRSATCNTERFSETLIRSRGTSPLSARRAPTRQPARAGAGASRR